MTHTHLKNMSIADLSAEYKRVCGLLTKESVASLKDQELRLTTADPAAYVALALDVLDIQPDRHRVKRFTPWLTKIAVAGPTL